MKRPATVLAVVAMTLAARGAHAQTADEKILADSLFEQGKKHMKGGEYAQACTKFEESLRLQRALGSLLFLADCHEQVGRTATAWTEFREAAALAKEKGDPREKVARKHALDLEPKLSRLVVVVGPEARVPGLQVTRDGSSVGSAAWGSEVPVDPGKHAVAARAPGRKPWDGSIEVKAGASVATVTVPALQEEPQATAGKAAPSQLQASGAEPAPVPWQPDHGRGDAQRWIGIGVGGLGLVGVALGAVFGLDAKSKLDDSEPHCGAGNVCDPTGIELRDKAIGAGDRSTVAFIVGGALLAGGAVLFFTAPRASPFPGPAQSATLAVTPTIGHSAAGLEAKGTW